VYTGSKEVNKTVFQCSVGHSLDLQGFEKHDGKRVLTDPQQKKEEYAQRFMIVFLPFRKKEDL
jgi:hypothetical protein